MSDLHLTEILADRSRPPLSTIKRMAKALRTMKLKVWKRETYLAELLAEARLKKRHATGKGTAEEFSLRMQQNRVEEQVPGLFIRVKANSGDSVVLSVQVQNEMSFDDAFPSQMWFDGFRMRRSWVKRTNSQSHGATHTGPKDLPIATFGEYEVAYVASPDSPGLSRLNNPIRRAG